MVTEIREDQQQTLLHQKETGRQDSGHPKARAQEAQQVHSSTMTKTEEREKEINVSECPVRQHVESLFENQKSATGQEQAFQDETTDSRLVTRKGVACKIKIAITATLRSAYFTKEVSAQQAGSVPSKQSQTGGKSLHQSQKCKNKEEPKTKFTCPVTP